MKVFGFRLKPNLITINCLITLFILSGCSNSESNVSFQSAGTTETFAQGKNAVPKDFALPIYPGSTVSGSISAEENNERSRFLILTSKDPIYLIDSYYEQKLRGDGWLVTVQNKSDNTCNLSCTKGDFEANVMATKSADKTTISLTVEIRQNEGKEGRGQTDKGNFVPNKQTPATD